MKETYVLILGATSDIAMAVAHEYARHGHNVFLAARNPERLDAAATDIEVRYRVKARPVAFDVLDLDDHGRFYESLSPSPIGVICAVGYLGSQEKGEKDFSEARMIFDVNFTGCASILNIVANDFAERSEGFIVAISSPAGDRGRKTNYYYGSAKAALTTYLSGLRNRLQEKGIGVLTVKPGFVRTRMTADMNLSPRLTAEPEEVARDIYSGQRKGRDIIYSKWYWRFIMMIIIHLPEKIFKRLSL